MALPVRVLTVDSSTGSVAALDAAIGVPTFFSIILKSASNPRDGLDLIATFEPDLILIGTGVVWEEPTVEVLRQIRYRAPLVPTVLVGSSSEDLSGLSKQAGADSYVTREDLASRPLEVVRDGLFRRFSPDPRALTEEDIEVLRRRITTNRTARAQLKETEREIDRFAHLVRQRDQLLYELQGVFRVFPDFCIRINAGQEITKWYGGDAALFARPERFTGKKIREIVPIDIAEQLEREVTRANGVRTLEYTLTLGGTPHWFEARMCRLPDGDVLAVVRDITDRHLEKVRYRTLFELTPAVIVGLDSLLRVVDWNHAAEELFGVPREEALGVNYVDRFLPPEAKEPVTAEVQRILAGGRVLDYRNQVLTARGPVTVAWNAGLCPYGVLAVGLRLPEESPHAADG